MSGHEEVKVVHVKTTESLSRMLKALQGESVLCVDTEFWSPTTFFPRLCLIQVCGEKTPNYLVDTIILPQRVVVDQLVLPLFYNNQEVLKVFHACSEDIEILHQYAGAPSGVIGPIFDTSLAWQVLFPDEIHTIGYKKLVEHYLAVEMSKKSQMTNWSKRPLKDSQIRYAALDVFYLNLIYPKMRAELESAGTVAEEERKVTALVRERCKPHDLSNGIHTVKNAGSCHTPERREHLYLLSAWREHLSATLNRPRRWVLTDGQMIQLTCQAQDQAQRASEGDVAYHFKLNDFHDRSPLLRDSNESISRKYCRFLTLGLVPPFSEWEKRPGNRSKSQPKKPRSPKKEPASTTGSTSRDSKVRASSDRRSRPTSNLSTTDTRTTRNDSHKRPPPKRSRGGAPDLKSARSNPRPMVCRMFKKGECRFGSRCRYSHDSPIV